MRSQRALFRKAFFYSTLSFSVWGFAIFCLADPVPIVEYQIHHGDTLSEISHFFSNRPIYGKKGSLSQNLSLNPKIKNPNYIQSGRSLYVFDEMNRALGKKIYPWGLMAPQDKIEIIEETAKQNEKELNTENFTTQGNESEKLENQTVHNDSEKTQVNKVSKIQTPKIAKKKKKVWNVELGLGTSFSQYQHKFTDVTDAQYASLGGLSYRLGLGWQWAPEIKAKLKYFSIPGVVKSNSTDFVGNPNYRWTVWSLETEWMKPLAQKQWITWGINGGFKRHKIPLLTAIDDDQVTLNSQTLNTVLLQGVICLPLSEWILLIRFGPEYIIQQSASDRTINNKTQSAVSGSLNLSRKLNKNLSLGAEWSGAWFKNQISFYDPILQQNVEGSREILYSDLSLILRYFW
ncbi:MAG: hypothetical protein K1X29_07485 [Bdellovibrionales bacterium]|nr:hypothetical protein [Bdellovibrionales bacterium]